MGGFDVKRVRRRRGSRRGQEKLRLRRQWPTPRRANMRTGAKLSVNAIVQYPIPLSTRLLRTSSGLIGFPLDLRPLPGARIHVCLAPPGNAVPFGDPRGTENALPRPVSQPH
jgi:hypothetical protein